MGGSGENLSEKFAEKEKPEWKSGYLKQL